MFARRNGLSPAPRRRHAPCSLCGRARVPAGRSALPSPMRHASTSRAASVLPPSRRVHSRVVERPPAGLVHCRVASVLSPTRLVHPRAAVHLTALAGVLTRLRTPGARSPSLAAGLARVFRLRCPRPPRRLPTNPRPRAVRDFYPHLWITFSRPITGSHPPPARNDRSEQTAIQRGAAAHPGGPGAAKRPVGGGSGAVGTWAAGAAGDGRPHGRRGAGAAGRPYAPRCTARAGFRARRRGGLRAPAPTVRGSAVSRWHVPLGRRMPSCPGPNRPGLGREPVARSDLGRRKPASPKACRAQL